MIEWSTIKVKVKDLKEWAKNPRKINEDEFNKLKESIEKRGFHDVLKVDTDMTVISGHQRKRALLQMGIEEVDVKMPDRDLTSDEREVIAIESNRHRGEFDFDKLANEFEMDNILDGGITEKELSVDPFQEEDKPKKVCPHCGMEL
jgi:site-specific DNA-methyltransferase (adenine-specific)